MGNNNICVLFGAGAECMYGLSNGDNFAYTVAGIDNEEHEVNQMNDAIKKYYNSKIEKLSKELKEWYPERHFNVKWNREQIEKASIRKNKVGKNENIILKERKEKNEKVKIKNNSIDISYMGLLDECFEALIAPRAFGKHKFWYVINAYTRAYLSIVSGILNTDGRSEIRKYNYDKILESPDEVMKLIRKKVDNEPPNSRGYYEKIRNFLLKKSNISINLITTNYTPYSEIKSSIHPKQIAYINGKLGWFESSYTMRAYDVEKEDDWQKMQSEDLYFPYLFVQSSTKPIVEGKLVNEFKKACDFISKTNRLIIVGYKLNCDDDHVNGLIRSAIEKGTETYYLSYIDSEGKYLSEEDVYKRLHLGNMKDKNVKNFHFEIVDADNSINKFEKVLNKRF